MRKRQFRRGNRPTAAGAAGFTLVELMITVACMGIIAAAAIPEVARVAADDRADRAASGLAGAIRYAQSEAVRTGRSIGVEAKASRIPSATNGFDDGNWFRVYDDASKATVLHPVTHRCYTVDFDSWGESVQVASVSAGADGLLLFSPVGDPSVADATFVIRAGDAVRTVVVRGGTGWVEVQ